jgi:hypothetical protein
MSVPAGTNEILLYLFYFCEENEIDHELFSPYLSRLHKEEAIFYSYGKMYVERKINGSNAYILNHYYTRLVS